MKITRNNYEPFFLDYLEGTLEETMIDQLLDFLKQNPDLKEELHLCEEIHLPVEPVVLKGKQALYKSADDESFDIKAVAYLEGDMTRQERHLFEAALERNPTLRAEYELFEMTRLKPDTTFSYRDKEKLYKSSGTILWLNWMGKAAAVLVLLLGIYSLFQKGEDSRITPPIGEVASIKTPAPGTPQVTERVASQPEPTHKNPIAHTARRTNNIPQGVKKALTPEVIILANQREAVAIQEITPIRTALESAPLEQTLVAIHPVNTEKINDPRNIMTLEEYLASKAKKATNGGILTANRLLQKGLNVASELSGDRLGYTVKNGKVASLEFESKLLAFDIPLEKK